jgi:adenylyltransferase/sulfurtransferase
MAKQITVQQLAEKLAVGEPVQLIDVRKTWEHETASIPGSILIPLDQLPHRVEEVKVPEKGIVVAYCHHGIRSLSAANFLEQQGVTPVFSLAGGIDAWSLQVDPRVPRY